MKETRFIDQNKDRWESIEKELIQKRKDPDKLSDLYVQLTDDLSYSKTYYPNRLVRAYLNNISQKIYLNFYKNQINYFKNFAQFWKEDLPYIVYSSRKELMVSFFVFTLATLIGILSCLKDPAYAEVVVGKSYVEMTNENIANNDPMAVYKQEEQMLTTLKIFWNNIRVAFYTFVLGITAGIATLFILLMNGTMLGGFQFFFFDKGVFVQSLITIWQHGTIEVLAIIIAGGAGLVLAKGLILPGTFSRLQSLQMATKRGLNIMLGLSPFILLAAFIEGYITRLTEAPIVFRIGLILSSLILMFGYWVYYPWRKKREGFSQETIQRVLKFERPIEKKLFLYNLSDIKGVGQLFSDTFGLFRANIKSFFIFSLLIGILYGLAHVNSSGRGYNYIQDNHFLEVVSSFIERQFFSFFSFFKFANNPLFRVLNMIMLGMLFSITFVGFDQTFALHQNLTKTQKAIKRLQYFVYGSVASVVLYGVFYFDSIWSYVGFILLLPIVIMPFSAFFYDKKGFWYALKIILGNLLSVFLVLAVFFVLFLCFMFIANVGIVSLILDFISMNFQMTASQLQAFYNFSSAFLSMFTFSFFFPIFIYGFTFKYYSNKEYLEANHLIRRIKNM